MVSRQNIRIRARTTLVVFCLWKEEKLQCSGFTSKHSNSFVIVFTPTLHYSVPYFLAGRYHFAWHTKYDASLRNILSFDIAFKRSYGPNHNFKIGISFVNRGSWWIGRCQFNVFGERKSTRGPVGSIENCHWCLHGRERKRYTGASSNAEKKRIHEVHQAISVAHLASRHPRGLIQRWWKFQQQKKSKN